MAILLTTYGGVYGEVNDAQKLTNKLALQSAVDAAIAASDYVSVTGRYQVILSPSQTAIANATAARVRVTTSGTCDVRGTDNVTCYIDLYLNYGAGSTKAQSNNLATSDNLKLWHLLYSSQPNVNWAMSNIGLEGPTSIGPEPRDRGVVPNWINHALTVGNSAGAVSTLTWTNVRTGGFVYNIQSTGGRRNYTFTSCNTSSNDIVVAMFDHEDNASEGSTCTMTNCTHECNGLAAADADDGQKHGGVCYLNPTVGLDVSGATVNGAWRTAYRIYSSSKGYQDYNSFVPSIARMRDMTFTDNGGGTIFMTPDAPVDCEITNVTVEGGGGVTVRCNTTITNLVGAEFSIGDAGGTEEQQARLDLVIDELVTSTAIPAEVLIRDGAGWNTTMTGGSLTIEAGASSETKLVASASATGSRTLDGVAFVSTMASDNGIGYIVSEADGGPNALLGCTFTGRWGAGIQVSCTGAADVTLRGNDFSAIQNGRGVNINAAVTAGSVKGENNTFAASEGVRVSTGLAGQQRIVLKRGTDPTTRTPSSGTLKLPPTYSVFNLGAGAVNTLFLSTGSNDAKKGFEGYVILIASASTSFGTSGNITPDHTNTRTAGEECHFVYRSSLDKWVETSEVRALIANGRSVLTPKEGKSQLVAAGGKSVLTPTE